MTRRLLIRVGELDYVAISVGPSDEGDSGWKIVRCESCGDGDRRHVHQKGVQNGSTPLIAVRRCQAIANGRRLVLDRFHDNRIEAVIGNDSKQVRHEPVARDEILIVLRLTERVAQAVLRKGSYLLEL